jgi:hypothetical protein
LGIDEGEPEDADDTDNDTDHDAGDDTDDSSDNDDAEAPDVYLAKSYDLRKEFLSEFSADEVVEIWQIHNFMVFVSIRIQNSTSEPTMHDCGLRTCTHLRQF